MQGVSIMGFLFVSLGGALGAAGRYAISLLPVKTGFPNAVLFWKTGICGGFTTFSTFSIEAFALFENKAFLAGGIYMFLSVACCLAGVFCGKKLYMLIH